VAGLYAKGKAIKDTSGFVVGIWMIQRVWLSSWFSYSFF
jgi:hypothetical protein